MWVKLLLFIFVLIMAILAHKLKALKLNGAVSAIFVGTMIIIGTGITGLILMGIFFVTSTFWSKWKKNLKSAAEEIVEKGDERDYGQVLANGGIPALLSLVYFLNPNPIWLFAYAVAFASANADTWASEIGVLSKKDPILLTTGKRVARGTSGAVSSLGSFAGFLGSLVIGISAIVMWKAIFDISHIFWISLFGFINMLVDTMIGSTIQEKRCCKVCGKITEKYHHCDIKTVYVKGLPGLNNDWVNFLSIFISTGLSMIFYFVFLS